MIESGFSPDVFSAGAVGVAVHVTDGALAWQSGRLGG